MSIYAAETTILHRDDLTVADLYGDLVRRVAHRGQMALVAVPSSVAFAEGADCLCAAVAHLCDGAGRLASDDPELRDRLVGLAAELVIEAARFEEHADS